MVVLALDAYDANYGKTQVSSNESLCNKVHSTHHYYSATSIITVQVCYSFLPNPPYFDRGQDGSIALASSNVYLGMSLSERRTINLLFAIDVHVHSLLQSLFISLVTYDINMLKYYYTTITNMFPPNELRNMIMFYVIYLGTFLSRSRTVPLPIGSGPTCVNIESLTIWRPSHNLVIYKRGAYII